MTDSLERLAIQQMEIIMQLYVKRIIETKKLDREKTRKKCTISE